MMRRFRLNARVHVRDHVLERGVGDAERVRRDAGARLVQGGEQDPQAVARLSKQVGARHAGAREIELGGGGAAVTHLVLEPADREARRALLDDQCRDGAFVVGDLAPFAEQQDALGDVTVGNEDLGAVDDDLVASRREPGLHAGGVRAGAGLGDGESAKAALGDPRQQAAPLLLRAEVDQRLHAVEIGGVDDAGRRAGAGNRLHRLEIDARSAPERRRSPRARTGR